MTETHEKVPILKIHGPKRPGLRMCTALVVGNMIGSGLFDAPASSASTAWNAVFGWLLTIGGALCLASCSPAWRASSSRPAALRLHAGSCFGRWSGFMVAWSY